MTTTAKTHDANFFEKNAAQVRCFESNSRANDDQSGTVSKRPSFLHEFLEMQAEKAPYQTALESADQKLTYQVLNSRANQVANYLIGKGVQTGDVVALYQERSVDLFICLLGVLKAGAAYLPIDPDETPASASNIVAKFDPKLILTTKKLSENLTPSSYERSVAVDEKRESFDTLSSQNRIFGNRNITAEDTSHIMFRADPDGALEYMKVRHREAVTQLRSLLSVYGLDNSQRCYQENSLAFDVAVEEVWAMLSAGATVILRENRNTASANMTARFLSEQTITLYSTVPEILAGIEDELSNVNVLIIGRKRCSSELAVKWALKKQRVVSLKNSNDRFPSFSIDQESRPILRPRLLRLHSGKRMAA